MVAFFRVSVEFAGYVLTHFTGTYCLERTSYFRDIVKTRGQQIQVALVLVPTCFTPSCFDAHCQYEPLFKLRHLIFNALWLAAVHDANPYLFHYFLVECHFLFTPLDLHTFTQLGR
jgi:hypothetical protein